MPLGGIHETVTLTSLIVNLDCAELALTSSVAILTQTVLLLGGRVLLCGHDTTMLVKDQFALGEATRSLVGSSVPHLGARSLQHLILLAVHVVVTIITAIATFHHFTK